MRPPAATTRCHGTPLFGGRPASTLPTSRAWRGSPARAATDTVRRHPATRNLAHDLDDGRDPPLALSDVGGWRARVRGPGRTCRLRHDGSHHAMRVGSAGHEPRSRMRRATSAAVAGYGRRMEPVSIAEHCTTRDGRLGVRRGSRRHVHRRGRHRAGWLAAHLQGPVAGSAPAGRSGAARHRPAARPARRCLRSSRRLRCGSARPSPPTHCSNARARRRCWSPRRECATRC